MTNTTLKTKQNQVTAAPSGPSFLVQRKCSCGGTSKLSGECKNCEKENLLGVQPKLRVGPANDVYEQEADRMADQVMGMSDSQVHQKTENLSTQNELIHRKGMVSGVSRTAAVSHHTESKINQMNGSGSPLPKSALDFFDSRFGADFSKVRIHTGESSSALSKSINARAFTVGRNIAFAQGEYAPHSNQGRRLIAHELTHVIQQTGPQLKESGDVIQRSKSPGVEKMEDLLSYGIIDWKIFDSEAIHALTILQGLPKIQQAEFVSNTKYLNRLRDNLPEERLPELESIVASVAGALPQKDILDDIISKLSYGIIDWVITEAEAVAALDQLKTLSGEQLAVALSRIDYGRLMENLPNNRKKELIDLLANGLGTGGVKDVSEVTNPGTMLKSIRFSTDHSAMKDNTKDWENTGTSYPDPEWKISSSGDIESFPISHTKDSNVGVEMNYDVMPQMAQSTPIRITGTSDASYLNFSYSGVETGGKNKKAAVTSQTKLPNSVGHIKDKFINWKMKWGTREYAFGRSGPHAIFTTMNMPRNLSEVTHKRMAFAADMVGKTGSLVPHEIVRTIMSRWNNYNLDVQYQNAWKLADDLEKGAQCIDLVRFVQGILNMVGVPGNSDAVVVWAQPSAPLVAIESPWKGGGMVFVPRRWSNPTWSAWLLDGDFRPNNFEAALKFDHGGIVNYYPGGVKQVMKTPDEVLRVFNCMAWIRPVGSNSYEIMEVPASYRGGCQVGARHKL